MKSPFALTILSATLIVVQSWWIAMVAEGSLSDEAKAGVATWLVNRGGDWRATYRTVFDGLFGRRFMSWHRFLIVVGYSFIGSQSVYLAHMPFRCNLGV